MVSWFSFTDSIIKKFERDKYLFIFEQKYMKEFEENKFDILDSVKEINIGNKLPVTLSLGFGLNGGTLAENLRYAAASIDLALGRGRRPGSAEKRGKLQLLWREIGNWKRGRK